jgi:inositol phosphorylceramide synthase catalytic subunit
MTEFAPALRARFSPAGYGAGWARASWWALPLGLGVLHATVGLRPEHLALAALLFALTWGGEGSRRFMATHAPFVAVGLVYDMSRLFFINGRRGGIHVGDLWAAERALFGFDTAGGRVAFADVVAAHPHPALDLLCGAVYLLYIAQVFATTSYLFFRKSPRAARLGVAFAIANVIGWAVWLLWPAAPPWYVDRYGVGPAVLSAASDPAGASRFDALLGVHVFSGYYSRAANVFGAMPSLHVAYATLPALVVWPLGGALRVATVAWALLMAFSAVYFRHHYVLDALAGAAVAVAAERAARAALGLAGSRAKQPLQPAPSEVWP